MSRLLLGAGLGVDVAVGDVTAPTVSSVAATPTDTTVSIVVVANEAADVRISYGTTTGYGTTTSLTGAYATSKTIAITGLAGGTTYHFQPLVQDLAGNVTTGDDYTFTTTPNAASIFAANLVFWISAAKEAVVATGTGVQTPTDQDGNSYSYTQSTSGQRPTYATNAFGDGPGYQFTAASSQFWSATRANTTTLDLTGDRTILVHFKTTGTGQMGFINRLDQVSSFPGWEVSMGQSSAGLLDYWDDASNTYKHSTAAFNDGLPHVAVWVLSGTTLTLYVDGGLQDTWASISNATNVSANPSFIGVASGGSGYVNGTIGDVVLANSAATATQLDQVGVAYGL